MRSDARRARRRSRPGTRRCRTSPPRARRVGAEREAESYGTLSHLCPSQRPRVGELDAVDQVPRCAGLAAAHSPNAPSTCTHPPCRVRERRRPRAGRRRRRCSRCRPAGRRWSGRPGRAPSTSREVADVDRAVGVGRHRLDDVGAEAEQPQRPVDGGVPLVAGDHPDRRRAEQAVALDVPAGLGQHVVPGGGEADGVGRLAPVTKPTDASAGRPSSSFSQPPATSSAAAAAGDGDRVERVLVPAGGEHVGRGRRGQRAADDEPEVARAGAWRRGRARPRRAGPPAPAPAAWERRATDRRTPRPTRPGRSTLRPAGPATTGGNRPHGQRPNGTDDSFPPPTHLIPGPHLGSSSLLRRSGDIIVTWR